MRKIAFIVLLIASAIGAHAQTHACSFKENIRTLRVERMALVLENGVVDGSDPENTLHISFDEMSHDVHFYTYTVRMMDCCNDGMMNDRVVSGEYLKGFTTRDIVDYEHSINTSREYTHYWFDFPNEDMRLTMSGQYLLSIYEDGNPDNKVAEVSFCVVEPLVKIDARVRANTDIEFNGRYQQVDIDVNTAALDMRNPDEVRVVVTQNNSLQQSVMIDRPTFVETNRLRYINNKDLIFEGGNEYHHFDAFSCFYAGYGIDRVYHEMGDYHVLLFPSEVTKGQYIHEYDSDGRFVVNAERTADSDTEAEYMWVHWTLPMEKPFFDGALYVDGDMFQSELTLRNRMEYDADAKCYWLTSLVKQGGYDYRFVFKPKVESQKSKVESKKLKEKTTTQKVDGSYWQTENEYTIYVFWKPVGSRSERLVGIQAIRSNAL